MHSLSMQLQRCSYRWARARWWWLPQVGPKEFNDTHCRAVRYRSIYPNPSNENGPPKPRGLIRGGLGDYDKYVNVHWWGTVYKEVQQPHAKRLRWEYSVMSWTVGEYPKRMSASCALCVLPQRQPGAKNRTHWHGSWIVIWGYQHQPPHMYTDISCWT